MRIFVLGHKSPDLDAIASSVVYKDLLTTLNQYKEDEIIAACPEEVNSETKYVFDKFGIELPKTIETFTITENDAFILTDHNEQSQRSDLINGDNILEIVDHHKVNLVSAHPIRVITEPLGSTCSVIVQDAKRHAIDWPGEKIKKLILAAILSDTQGLKSSTTTGIDSNIANKFAEELDIDKEKLTFDIFKAKSDLSGLTKEEIATKDYKVFAFGDRQVFINQVETVEPEAILEQKGEYIKILTSLKAKLGVTYTFIVVTDILKVNSHVIYANDEEKSIIEEAFTTIGENNAANIGPKMSRKKDVAPAIEKVITAQQRIEPTHQN